MITNEQLDVFIHRAFDIASRHGFHDECLSFEHLMMLVLSEVGEAIDADRSGKHANMAMFEHEITTPQSPEHITSHWRFCFEMFIKDTVEDELADVCIRLFDMCGVLGIDLPDLPVSVYEEMANEFRENFGSQSFCERCFSLSSMLCYSSADTGDVDVCTSLPNVIYAALVFLFTMSDFMGIDLIRHIELKMEYNEHRARLHGKKY